jgi:hypothetical protein
VAAHVTSEDRDKVEKRTGDRSFPTETASQVRSAIKMRHNGKSKTASEVLGDCSSAVGRLLSAGKINAGQAKELRDAIARARQTDMAAD